MKINFFLQKKGFEKLNSSIKRVGILAVSNTTINYTMKLPATLTTTEANKTGAGLVAQGGALFIKLLATPAGYIGANDKVKVTLTDVTATFTGKADATENKDGQSQPYGIFVDSNRSEEKNLEVTSGIDNNFVRFNKAS